MTTPIYEAASNGHIEALALLIKHGADIDKRYKRSLWEGTALFHACRKSITAVRLLLPYVTDINAYMGSSNDTALMHATYTQMHSIMQLLIDNGADVDKKTNTCRYYTPIFVTHDIHTIGLLIKNGAKVNIKDRLGQTPLHNAAYLGHNDICHLLLDNGADINAICNNGRTPLGTIQHDHPETVRLLIKRGADVNIGKQYHSKPLLHILTKL